MAVYLNFDEMVSEKRLLMIGEREFDVTDMPVKVMLFLNNRTVERKKENSEVLFTDYYEALYTWFKEQNADVTSAWMDEHISGSQLKQIIHAVFVPLLNPSPVAFVKKEALTKDAPRKNQ
jgi:hypothetical protein